MKRWTWIVGAGLGLSLAYFFVDEQNARARQEKQQLISDIEAAENIFADARHNPLGRSTDLESLLRMVGTRRRSAEELDQAFVVPAEIDNRVQQQIRDATISSDPVRGLVRTRDRDLDFISVHNFKLTLAGSRKDLIAAARRLDEVALLASWTAARWSSESKEAQLQLEFEVYSVLDSPLPPAISELGVCSSRPVSRVWLPWQSGEIVRLQERRRQLCADSVADPRNTAAALELHEYTMAWLVRKELLEHLRSKRQSLEAVLSKESPIQR